MLYTNGLALHGKKLDATLANCDQIHISQNFLDKKTYQSVIYKGNFENSMRNLRELATKKSPKHHIQLSLVLLRETISSIPKFISAAKTLGFQKVIVKHGSPPVRRYSYEMPASSYEYKLSNDFINENSILAKMTRVLTFECHTSFGTAKIKASIPPKHYMVKTLKMTSVYLVFPRVKIERGSMKGYPGWDICMDPFKELHIYLNYNGDYTLNYCCKGYAGIIINEKLLGDMKSVWHNPRVSLIRNTVNDLGGWYKNKMCMTCRCWDRFADEATKQEVYRSFNIKLEDNSKRPIYFENLYI